MAPAEMLDRQWAALKTAGLLVPAVLTPSDGGTISADVLYDAPGTLALADLSVVDHSVRFRTSGWPALRSRETVAIGAATYEVLDVVPLDDGLMTRATLRRLS